MKVAGQWIHAQQVQAIFREFTDRGFQILVVGGCVRNDLLGVGISDIDFATDAHPDETCRVARNAGWKAIRTGAAFGTITVVVQGTSFEVTTFRRDVETDGRRAVVSYAEDAATDAHRRDFTMNALYADAAGTVIDPLGGLADLRARCVRFIDEAETRIREDALRILRFFRFYAWYGDPAGGLDPEGLAACAELADLVEDLSRERVGAEMRRLLAARDPAPAVASMARAGVLPRILPGAEAGALAPLIDVEGDRAPRWQRRLAALGGEDWAEHLRLSKTEAQTHRRVQQEIGSGAAIKLLGYRIGAELACDVALIRAAMGLDMSTDFELEAAEGARAQFPVKSRDLIGTYGEGPELGEALRTLEERWIASGFTLSRLDLLS